MKRFLTWLTFFVLPVSAQYTGLVATRDGNQVYFSSSLRLRGTGEVDSPKIFRYSTIFELIQQPNAASGQALVEPEVSADGAITGYTASTPGACFERFCFGAVPPEFGVISGVQIPHNPLPALTGRLRLARDGKSAMICCSELAPRSAPQLIDLETGTVSDLQGFDAIGDGRQAFGNLANGSTVVLLIDATGPFLYQRGRVTRLHFSHAAILARMNSNATMIVYEAADPGAKNELIAHHVGTGTEQILQRGPSPPAGPEIDTSSYFQPWLSDDGSSVLFLALDATGHQQVFFEATNGSGVRALTTSTDIPEGMNAATLAGDGTFAYASTPDGRILRISLSSGSVDELARRTPQINLLQNPAVGSVNWISGLALSAGDTLPQVLVGDIPAPVISAEPTLVKFQIPWEVRPGGPVEIRLQYGPPPPFESVLTFQTATVAGNFLSPTTDPFLGPLLALHHDFHSLVTPSNPASPGEIIHFYMTGLGPVTPSIATGQRTPASGLLHRVVYPPVFCTVSNIGPSGATFLDAPVPFLGLAPDYIGLYQMNLQVPPGLLNADSALSCGIRDIEQGGYAVAAVELYVRVH